MDEHPSDFLITEVIVCEDEPRIVAAVVWQDLGDMFAGRQVMSREDLLSFIASGRIFRTMVRDEKGDWKKGPIVEVRVTQQAGYLKIAHDEREADGLGSVPRVVSRPPRVRTGDVG